MTAATIITECFSNSLLALTPQEKWAAARSFSSGSNGHQGFVIVGLIAIVILAALLAVVSYYRRKQERDSSNDLFFEYAEKQGLNARECRILLDVAKKAELKRNESIFTLVTAFDRGANIIQDALAGRRNSKEASRLRTDLSFLREKLGFRKQISRTGGFSGKTTKLSSRQIPTGKKIQLSRRNAADSETIAATVTKNDDDELTIKLEDDITITFGQSWCVRYYFGSSVWEFDTLVNSYGGGLLVLAHSDNVRFINRRRFLRVPVSMPAFIAKFPFDKSSLDNPKAREEKLTEEGEEAEQVTADTALVTWEPPEFVPAVVTELAALGLRIESSLEVKPGERILVVFNLDQEYKEEQEDEEINPSILKIVEDIGEVRHTEQTEDGLSIAVELTGLSDSNLDELICITNAALLEANKNKNENLMASENIVQRVPQHNSI